jgi:hypothetical protein
MNQKQNRNANLQTLINEMKFPKIFITGKLPENWTKKSLIAKGLTGWGCCMAGAKPPEKFGEGMALISNKVGTSTPDGLSELANKMSAKK